MPWNDISTSQEYINADPAMKFTIKSSYFDNNIAPDLPMAGRGAAKKKWMETDSNMINVASPAPVTPEVRSQNEFGADTLSDIRRRSAEYSTGTYRNPQVAAREIGEPGLARAAQRSVEQQALVPEQDTYVDKLGQAVGSGFRQSVEGDRVVRSGMGVGPDVEAPHRTGQIGGALGDLYERAKKAETDDEYTDIRHDAINRISDFYDEMPVKSPEVKGYWKQVGMTLAESGPNMLATFVLPAAGYSLNWSRAAGNKALELRQKGVADPDLRNKVATGYGAVSAFGETVGDLVQFGAAGRVGKAMLKGIRKPGRKAAAGFLNSVKDNPVAVLTGGALKRLEPILSGATGEVASEVIDAYAGAAADVVATNPNGTMKEWREAYSKTVTSDKFKNDLAESVKIAAGAGAVIPGAAVAVQTSFNLASAPTRDVQPNGTFRKDKVSSEKAEQIDSSVIDSEVSQNKMSYSDFINSNDDVLRFSAGMPNGKATFYREARNFIFNLPSWTNQKFNDRFSPMKAISAEAYRLARTYAAYKDSAAIDFGKLQKSFAPVAKHPDAMTGYFKAVRDELRARRGFISPGYQHVADADPQVYAENIAAEAANIITNHEEYFAQHGIGEQQLYEVVEAWKDWNWKRLKAAVDAGVMSAEQAENMHTQNPFYATYQVLEQLPDDIEKLPIKGSGEYFSVSKPFTGKIRGTERQVGDVIEATLQKDMEARALFARNKVARWFINDYINGPEMARRREALDDQIAPLIIKQNLTKAEANKLAELREEREMTAIYRVVDSTKAAQAWDARNLGVPAILQGKWDKRTFDTISFFKDGELQRYLVPKEYAQMLKSLDAHHAIGVIRFMNDIFRKGATTYNPAFIPVNLIRDTSAMLAGDGSFNVWDLTPIRIDMNTKTKLRMGRFWEQYAKALGEAFVYQFGYAPGAWVTTKPMVKWIGDHIKVNDGQATLGDQVTRSVDQYFASGGGMGFTGSEGNLPKVRKSQLFNAGRLKKIGRMVNVFTAIDKLNDVVELAPRMATARQSHVVLRKKMERIDKIRRQFQAGSISKQEATRRMNKVIPNEAELARVSNLMTAFAGVTPGSNLEQQIQENVDRQLREIKALQGREATIDFNKAGQWARVINAYIPFFNAGLRGSGKLLGALFDPRIHKRETRARLMKNWSMLIMTVGVLQAMHIAANYSDEETEELYNDIPDWERWNYWCWVIGSEYDENKGRDVPVYFKLPKGEFGKLANVMENVFLDINDKPHDDHTEVFARAMTDIVSLAEFAGFGSGKEEAFSAERIVNKVSPPMVKLILEPGSNKDYFTGKEIEPKWMKSIPEHKRYYKSTPVEWIALSRALYEKGIKISPLMLQNAAKNIGAAWGSRPLDTFTMKTLVRRFYGKRGGQKEIEASRLMYGTQTNYDQLRHQIANLFEEGNTSEAGALMLEWNSQVLPQLREDLIKTGYKDPRNAVKRFKITHIKIKKLRQRKRDTRSPLEKTFKLKR
ncbi:MAG: hypothetical protein KQI78_12210 [Deltaproteobacteria bacterium]|nr:hypothetical protein [Deltaproteobacteria bacterium]